MLDAPGVDLLGDPLPRMRTWPTLAEAAALVEVLLALRAHPRVAWAQRLTTGGAKIGSRFVRFGWPGAPDVIGQLRDGRLLAVEVKGPRGRLRPEQAAFLAQVNRAGGIGFVARSLRDVLRELGPLEGALPACSRRAGTGTPASRTGLIEQVDAGAAR